MRKLEAEVIEMGHIRIVVSCGQREYDRLLRCSAKYFHFTSIWVGEISGNPSRYEEVEFNIIPNTETDRKKYLECLRDLTRILLHN